MLLVFLFFWCKPCIIHAQLRRLISRALWDSNGRQALPKSFNVTACSRLDSNPGPWLSYKRFVSSHLNALGYMLVVFRKIVTFNSFYPLYFTFKNFFFKYKH